ncbi:MAG: murein biosynthesis integral membrane protein MurJ [Pseudomonadota bacterium]
MNTPKTSIGKKVGLASLIMMGSVFASRIIGLAREMVIAYAGGAGGSVDAYQVSFIIPEILNHCVASGFLTITFIPIFSACLARNDEDQGWRIFSIIMNAVGVFLLALTVLAFFLAPQLVDLLAPGFTDPSLKARAVRMTRIILPAQYCFFTGGLFMAVQFAKERFFIPALAPLIYNIGIIAGGLVLSPYLGMEGFAWGVLFGAFTGNCLIQYLGARQVGMRIYPLFNIRNPDFIRYILLTLPLMVGLTMSFSTELLLKYFGSFLSPGNIAALNYSLRIMFILVGLFGQAVGVASYPYLTQLAARGRMDELNQLLNQTLKYLLLVIPASVLIIVLRHEIVLLLFQRGRFNAEATQLTARILPYLMAGTFAFAAQTVVVRGYYATQNTWFPALFSTLAVCASLPLYYILMNLMGARGIALALSLGAAIQVGLLFELWNRKSRNRAGRKVYGFCLKILLLSLAMGLVLTGVTSAMHRFVDATAWPGALIVSCITGAVFLGLFVISGSIFKIEEIDVLTRRIRSKLSGLSIRP